MKHGKKDLLRLLLACGLMMSPLLGHAYAEPKVVVSTTAGASYEFYISDNPQITYQDNLLVIKNDKALSVSIEAADVSEFKFYSSDATAIEGVEAGRGIGSMMSGLTSGTKVNVIALDGKTVQSISVGNDGKAELDFNSLPKGVYVVKTPKGSFKIQK